MKKLFALLLAITMMATLSVTAFAADYDTAGDKGMTVTYSVAPAYTVTIPTDVTIDGNSTTISAEDVVVEKGQYVSVTLAAENNFTVTTAEGATLDYTVTANGANVAAGDEILAVNPADGKTGTATVTFDIDESAIKYAGTYTGTATFTISVKDVPKTIINFTIYNPAGDSTTEYSAEKGMTWGDWLESTYNNAGFAVRSDGGITYITIGSSYAGVALELSFLVEDFVKSTDVIQEGYEYVWMQIAG